MNRREALVRVGYLMGGALAAPTVAGVLGGCQVDTGADWSPVILNADQAQLVSSLTEQMLPETNTPGARAAGVPQFIDRMLDEWYPEALRQRFVDGLEAFEQDVVARTGNSFSALAMDQQRQILTELDREEFTGEAVENPGNDPGADPYDVTDSTDVVTRSTLSDSLRQKVGRQIDEAAARVAARRPDGGPVVRADVAHDGPMVGEPSFYRMLKELTLVGYYTSEVGATEALAFVQVPGRWNGCIPFSEVGRTWAI